MDAEGEDPGERDDGADNDVEGAFDCDDDQCAGAPVCTDGGGGCDCENTGGGAATALLQLPLPLGLTRRERVA